MNESIKMKLADLIAETEKYMISVNYAVGTISIYKSIWNKLLSFAEIEYYDRSVALQFLDKTYYINDQLLSSSKNRLPKKQRAALRAINVLEDFFQNQCISYRYYRGYDPKRIGSVPETIYDVFFAEYMVHFKSQSPSKSWEKSTILGLGIFLKFLYQMEIKSLQEIDKNAIIAFIDYTEKWANPLKSCRYKQVSLYLQWQEQKGNISGGLSRLFPKVKRNPPKLPQIWTNDEIQAILNSIDRSNPVGKRNYAIFLIAARTTLRISDVVTLSFSEIEWRKKCLCICQNKTNEIVTLPINREIVDALIDYIKNGRPDYECEYVFISHNHPYHPLAYHNNFYPEFKKYLRRAGVTITNERRTGAHTLRHSGTTNMITAGADLENVSMIEGHTNIDTTKTYIRTNTSQLMLCAIEPDE